MRSGEQLRGEWQKQAVLLEVYRIRQSVRWERVNTKVCAPNLAFLWAALGGLVKF